MHAGSVEIDLLCSLQTPPQVVNLIRVIIVRDEREVLFNPLTYEPDATLSQK
jgi:hypothetical protein